MCGIPQAQVDRQAANGRVKSALWFRQFSLCGLRRVQAEFKLVCLALNLRRMGAVRAARGQQNEPIRSLCRASGSRRGDAGAQHHGVGRCNRANRRTTTYIAQLRWLGNSLSPTLLAAERTTHTVEARFLWSGRASIGAFGKSCDTVVGFAHRGPVR